MQQELALFPLNIFLLPGDYTQLYIFENRYKQLVTECLERGETFGIPFTNRLNAQNYGSVVEVVELLKRHPGGEMDIVIRARGLFELQHYFFQKPGKLYPAGQVHILGQLVNAIASEHLMEDFKQHLIDQNQFESELLGEKSLGLFDIANELYMSDLEKMELIHLRREDLMNRYLMNYLRYLKLLSEQENSVFKDIYLN